jgi:hypothetical protein
MIFDPCQTGKLLSFRAHLPLQMHCHSTRRTFLSARSGKNQRVTSCLVGGKWSTSTWWKQIKKNYIKLGDIMNIMGIWWIQWIEWIYIYIYILHMIMHGIYIYWRYNGDIDHDLPLSLKLLVDHSLKPSRRTK